MANELVSHDAVGSIELFTEEKIKDVKIVDTSMVLKTRDDIVVNCEKDVDSVSGLLINSLFHFRCV